MIEQMVTQVLSDGTLIQRMKPKAPAQYYKTYGVHSPVETHYRDATCHEVECPNSLKGWVTKLDVSTVAGADTANWVRMKSGRHYTYEQKGTIVTFHFPPGQKCFIPHKVALGRPELFVVTGGDWRGNPMSIAEYKHKNAENWVEDCALHQDAIAKIAQRG